MLVAVFNISRYRSDALPLARDGITHLELPEPTADALAEKTVSFRQALRTTTDTSADRSQRLQAQGVITQVLQWLWDTAAGPVLDALGHQRRPPADADWPQVWWAPGGLLGLLPLHAAGTLWEIDDQIAVTVADIFYTHPRTPDGTIDTSRAAKALHQVVRSVRDGHDLPGRLDRTRTPSLWAAYLHAGA